MTLELFAPTERYRTGASHCTETCLAILQLHAVHRVVAAEEAHGGGAEPLHASVQSCSNGADAPEIHGKSM